MIIELILSGYIDIIEKIFKVIGITKVKVLGVEISINNPTGNIDERIKKIEVAKQNLLDGLSAIKELEEEAEKNKREVEKALLKIETLKTNKNNLEEEIFFQLEYQQKLASLHTNEQTILQMKMNGYNDHEIAQAMCIQTSTVKIALQNIAPKMMELKTVQCELSF